MREQKQMIEQTNRLYSDLAWLWPLWGDPSEYAAYCENTTRLIRKYAKRDIKNLLNVCCGGGKNIYNLKLQFKVTGLDLSPAMLILARKLNPECEFIQADARDFVLLEKFDTILVDDGICYMTTEADLRTVFERCFLHLYPGGIMIVGPDDTKETFVQNKSAITPAATENKPTNIDVVFIENDYDPNPDDTVYDALMIYIIRENGLLRIEHDLHYLGLFHLDTWRKLLRVVGFEVHEEKYSEDGKDFVEFVCIRPA